MQGGKMCANIFCLGYLRLQYSRMEQAIPPY